MSAHAALCDAEDERNARVGDVLRYAAVLSSANGCGKMRNILDEKLAKLKDAARRGENTFEVLMEASRVCSLGQMSQALYEIGGRYRRAL